MPIGQASNLVQSIRISTVYIVALAFVYTHIYARKPLCGVQDTLTNRKTLGDVSGAQAAFLMRKVAIGLVHIYGCFSMSPMEPWNFSLPGFNSQIQMVCWMVASEWMISIFASCCQEFPNRCSIFCPINQSVLRTTTLSQPKVTRDSATLFSASITCLGISRHFWGSILDFCGHDHHSSWRTSRSRWHPWDAGSRQGKVYVNGRAQDEHFFLASAYVPQDHVKLTHE